MLNTLMATAIAATMTVSSVVAGLATGSKDNNTSCASSTAPVCTALISATIHTDVPDLVIVADRYTASSVVTMRVSSETTGDLPDIIVTARAIGSDLATRNHVDGAVRF
jgi:hypothetical protein